MVVTGGAKGIGRAVVERFAARGDEVVALGRDRSALSRLEDELCRFKVRTAVCDVTDEKAVGRTFDWLGSVDVLVNNAGTARVRRSPRRHCRPGFTISRSTRPGRFYAPER